MPEIIYVRRKLLSLRPVDPASTEALQRLPEDQDVRAEISRPRNLKHHRKWWALLNAIYPHQNVYATMDSFHAAIKCALGYGEIYHMPDGRSMMLPKSISFAQMDQTQFEQFYERALELITTRILPGVGKPDLVREVEEILAGHKE